MSHTNHTQYYELPQYVGSDIINPLVDTNGAYETIDTTMHNIAAEAGQGTSDIAALQSKVGDGVFDTTAQNATDAVNEVVAELDTNETGVKARLTTAESDIDTLQSQMVTAQGNITDLQNNKANTSDVNTALALKANQSEVDTLSTNFNSLKNELLNSYAIHEDAVVVTADGTKTVSELITDAYDLAVAKIATAGYDKVMAEYVWLDIIDGSIIAGVPQFENASGFNFTFSEAYVNTSLVVDHIIVRSTSPWCKKYDSATGTVTNYENDVPTSGKVMSVAFFGYKQIN